MSRYLTLDRPSITLENGIWAYRASFLGSCTRALVGIRLGYTLPPGPGWLAAAAVAGHRAEEWYVLQRVKQGGRILARQLSVELSVPGIAAKITGHLDGIDGGENGLHNGQNFTEIHGKKAGFIHNNESLVSGTIPNLLEIKSMSESRYQRWLQFGFRAFEKYRTQITIYATCVTLPVKYVVINRDSWNPKNQVYDEVDISYLPSRPYDIQPILDKVRYVEECAQCGILPNCDKDVEYCNMGVLCQKKYRRGRNVYK